MGPYSQDLRQRVIARLDAGDAVPEVAARYNVHPRTVERWRARQRSFGHVQPHPIPGRPRRLSPELEARLVEQSDAHDDDTLVQHAQRFACAHEVRVSRQTVGRTLLRARRTRKKDADGQ